MPIMSYEASSFLKNFIPSINKLPIVAGITRLINQIVVVTNPIANVLTVKIAKISLVIYIFFTTSNSSIVGVIAITKKTIAVAQNPCHQFISTPKKRNNKKYCVAKTKYRNIDIDNNRINSVVSVFSNSLISQMYFFIAGILSIHFTNHPILK